MVAFDEAMLPMSTSARPPCAAFIMKSESAGSIVVAEALAVVAELPVVS